MNEVSSEIKHKKLTNAHVNFVRISDMNLGDKYTNFENTILKNSNTLLYEIENKPLYFRRYSRGSIVKVRFGVNIGSEFSGEHFAIVVSKGDTAYNPVLHVIPISSKKHKRCVDLGNVLILDSEIEKLRLDYSKESDNTKKKKIKNSLKYYSKRDNITSYALIEHMKTISKMSIIPPINEYDYIDKIRISNEKMKEIDNNIIKEYTL